MIDFEVWWNGAHRGINADLLCVQAIDPPRPAPPLPAIASSDKKAKQPAFDWLHEEVQAALAHWRTVAELCAITCCPTAGVRMALQRLSRADRLDRRVREKRLRRRGQGWTEYRMRAVNVRLR